jgi:hypothetical protein
MTKNTKRRANEKQSHPFQTKECWEDNNITLWNVGNNPRRIIQATI